MDKVVIILTALLACFVQSKHSDDARRLVLVVSDGGGDDLIALMQLAVDSDTRLLAIVCTYGNVDRDQACSNILRLLNFINRLDIPLYVGSESPFVSSISFDGFFGPDGMGNASSFYPLPTPTPNSSTHGAIAMLEIVDQYVGQVSLVSLGPLTNEAIARTLDPLFFAKLREHVVMGGAMKGNIESTAEFNIYGDVESATVVFSKTPFPILTLPFDICSTVTPSWEWYDTWISHESATALFIKRVLSIATDRLRQNNKSMDALCDTMTTTVYLYPDVLQSTTLRKAEVEECGQVTRGQLAVDYRTEAELDSNVELVSSIYLDRLLSHWTDLVLDSQQRHN